MDALDFVEGKNHILHMFLIDLLFSMAMAAPLSANDVSVLLPLPRMQQSLDVMPAPWAKTAHGELLPQEIVKQFPNITMHLTEEESYNFLRLVSIRIDPCFPSPKNPKICQPQLRFVWQPFEKNVKLQWVAIDAAIHTFYDLTPQQFKKLIVDLRTIKSEQPWDTKQTALTVHPLLQNKGLANPLSRKFLTRIISEAGLNRMSRVAFMLLRGAGQVWTFGGFDIKEGKLSRIQIPRTQKFLQTFFNLASTPTFYTRGAISPAPQGEDTIKLIITDSFQISEKDELKLTEEVLAAYRIENPRLHNPSTMDCVSCHVAQPARMWADTNYPNLKLSQKAEAFKFKSIFNIENTSPHPGKTSGVRGFGYDLNEPAISQRVINETAVVLEQIED